MTMPKLIPAAMTDFKKIIENNYAFVDKTRFLKIYEESGATVSMFLRPRRFGKTMFTELLMYYYDIALKEEAERLFKMQIHRFSFHPAKEFLLRAQI